MENLELQRPMLANSDGTQEILTSPHYQQWIRMVKQTTRKRESIFKFIYQLLLYFGETGSLFFTLITGLIIPVKDWNETVYAVLLYIVSSVVCVLVAHFNKQHTTSNNTPTNRAERKGAVKYAWELAKTTQGVRYYREFTNRSKKLQIINPNTSKEVKITGRKLTALSELYEHNVDDARVGMYLVFTHSIPMSLLQSYFLFSNYQQFTLCDVEDLSRITTIIFALLHAAQAATAYEGACSDYSSALHFLSFWRSGGAHDIRVDSQVALQWTSFFALAYHFATILLRYYVFAYFLSVSVVLSLVCFLVTLMVNLTVERFFPSGILSNVSNPPYGLHTTASYIVHCYISIFSTVNTRYHLYSREAIKILRCRVPLVLLQSLQFIIPILVTFLLAGTPQTKVLLESLRGGNGSTNATTNELLSKCPELDGWYKLNPIFKKCGDFVFESYSQLHERFNTFNSLFNMVHLIWLLFYCQVVTGLVYGYAVKQFELWDRYPIVMGYSFWKTLFNGVFRDMNVGNNNIPCKNRLKKMMVLTIVKDDQFYKLTRTCCKQNVTAQKIEEVLEELIGRLTESDKEVNQKVNDCLETNHEFQAEFRQLVNIFCHNSRELRMVLIFMSYFDQKVYQLDSKRLKQLFQAMGIQEAKTV